MKTPPYDHRCRALLALSAILLMACDGTPESAPSSVTKTPAPSEAVVVGRFGEPQAAAATVTPDDPRWSAVMSHRVELVPAPPVHGSVKLRAESVTAPLPLEFRIAAAGDRLLVWLRWDDATQDATDAFDAFSDGAAVQFALSPGDETSFMMGTPFAPVNIWHWKASTARAQNLAAGGFGSLTALPVQDVTALGRYDRGAGQWTVVFARPFEAAGEFVARLANRHEFSIALAVWQGADKQRDGHKRTSPGWIRVVADATDDLAAVSPNPR